MSSLSLESLGYNYNEQNWSHWEVDGISDKSEYFWFERLDSEWWTYFSEFYWSKFTYVLVATYYLGIIVTQQFMKDRAPITSFRIPLTAVFMINAVFGIGCTIRTAPRVWDAISYPDSLYHLFCVRNGALTFEFFWVIMYHWSKLWQLSETFFIILLKKKLTLLHVVHHSTMAVMSAAIAPYGEPLMYCIFFLNVLQHSLTYPLLVAKIFDIKLWKGSNAFILILELGVVVSGVLGSIYTQAIMGFGRDCTRHPKSVVIFNFGIWAITILVGKMLITEVSNKKKKI